MKRALFTLALLAGVVLTANAQEWPRFRGKNGTGIGKITSLPDSFTKADYEWAVKIDGTGHGLFPGQFVAARIIDAGISVTDQTAWTLPVAAVVQHGETDYIFVRSEGGFDVRQVRVIGSDGGRVHLRAALDADDGIVISGVAALKALWLARSEEST